MIDRHDPRGYPDEIKECWAVHQVLRILGFSPDDIYVMPAKSAAEPDGPPTLFAVLKTQSKEFTVTLGSYRSESDLEMAINVWTEFVTRANAGRFDQAMLDEIYEASNIMRNRAQFLFALTGKGFKFLGTMN